VVASRILASAISEVGQGWQLGQHGKVGNSIEVHRGGEAHRSGLSTVAVARWRGSPVLGRRSTGALWWSSGMRRRRRTRT
jgi:hypothetical protein